MNRLMRTLMGAGALGLFAGVIDAWRVISAYIWST